MKKLLAIGLALVLTLALAAAPVLAAATVYTDKANWEAAVGSWATEDFSDATLNPGVSVVSDNGYVTGGLWWDRVDDGDWGDYGETTWTFADPIYAWGGTFDANIPGGPGSSIKVTYLDGTETDVGTIPATIQDTFWGFVANEPFTKVHLVDAELEEGACETYEMDDMVYSWSPQVDVDKVWTMTDVCFELDNDGDDQVSEDWDDGIDNDGDGLIDEDPSECGGASHTGTVITELEALVKGIKIHTVTPGQVYAMSIVTISEPVDKLEIVEDFDDCTGMLKLNPAKGGGKVIVVAEWGPDLVQILDAMDTEVSISGNVATIMLTDVPAGTYLVLVKFSPKPLKGADWPGTYVCDNINRADATIGSYTEGDSATATLTVVPRVPE